MKSPGLLSLIITILFAGLIIFAGAAEPSGPGDFTSNQFSKSGICSNCHGSSFGEWAGSMHSLADSDFFYNAMLQEYGVAAEAQGAFPPGVLFPLPHPPYRSGFFRNTSPP